MAKPFLSLTCPTLKFYIKITSLFRQTGLKYTTEVNTTEDLSVFCRIHFEKGHATLYSLSRPL